MKFHDLFERHEELQITGERKASSPRKSLECHISFATLSLLTISTLAAPNKKEDDNSLSTFYVWNQKIRREQRKHDPTICTRSYNL